MYYVTMIDNFMSGWGPATGKLSRFVVSCDTLEQASAVQACGEQRGDMRNVSTLRRDKPPYYAPANNHVSLRAFHELGPAWRGDV